MACRLTVCIITFIRQISRINFMMEVKSEYFSNMSSSSRKTRSMKGKEESILSRQEEESQVREREL